MTEIITISGLLSFTALMWWLSGKWDDYIDRKADATTRVEQERHDLQIALLKASYGKKGKK
jgi:hypothetical protein